MTNLREHENLKKTTIFATSSLRSTHANRVHFFCNTGTTIFLAYAPIHLSSEQAPTFVLASTAATGDALIEKRYAVHASVICLVFW